MSQILQQPIGQRDVFWQFELAQDVRLYLQASFQSMSVQLHLQKHAEWFRLPFLGNILEIAYTMLVSNVRQGPLLLDDLPWDEVFHQLWQAADIASKNPARYVRATSKHALFRRMIRTLIRSREAQRHIVNGRLQRQKTTGQSYTVAASKGLHRKYSPGIHAIQYRHRELRKRAAAEPKKPLSGLRNGYQTFHIKTTQANLSRRQ